MRARVCVCTLIHYVVDGALPECLTVWLYVYMYACVSDGFAACIQACMNVSLSDCRMR